MPPDAMTKQIRIHERLQKPFCGGISFHCILSPFSLFFLFFIAFFGFLLHVVLEFAFQVNGTFCQKLVRHDFPRVGFAYNVHFASHFVLHVQRKCLNSNEEQRVLIH